MRYVVDTHSFVHVKHAYTQTYIRKQIQVIEGDTSLDETERTRRKQVSPPVQYALPWYAIPHYYLQGLVHCAGYCQASVEL